MEHTLQTFAKDSPLYGVSAATLMGIGLPEIILWLAAAYGVVRLAMVLVEFYWKIKDRKNGGKQ